MNASRAGLFLGLCLLATTAAATPGDEPVIYTAREFITMDPARPRAKAIAVKGSAFLAVGDLDDVRRVAGSTARHDNSLEDKVVVAGFIEQHVHPFLAAVTMTTRVIAIEDWETADGFSAGVREPAGYRARLRKALQAHGDAGDPFISWGYHHYFHGEMSRALLDQLAGDTPTIIWHRSAHEFFLNTAALKLVGIDETLTDRATAAARQQIDLEAGHFYEQGAIAALPWLAPYLMPPERFRRGLEYTEAYYHRNGITLACEPGGFLDRSTQQAINAVYSDDATPFNHCFIADGKTLLLQHGDDRAALLQATAAVASWGQGRTFFLPGQVKLFTDGAIYSQLMQMRDGYTDGHHGEWIIDPPLFNRGFQAWWDAGYQIHVHNNGDGGLDVLLASLEEALLRNPRDDHRTTLVHFGFAAQEQVERWIELGGIVSANPYYVTALATRYSSLGLGPERAPNMVPLADVVKNGGSFSLHSDMPMAPARPLYLAWAAVNRRTAEGEIAGPLHRISVEQALRAITLDAAYSIRMEDRVGSIEVGKDANLTVLDESPLAVDPDHIKDIGVWGTMLEGRLQPAR